MASERMACGSRSLERRGWRIVSILWLLACCLAAAQTPAERDGRLDKELIVDTTVTNRFVAVHGRRAVVMGYPERGLEVWAYPFQLLDQYHVGFRLQGGAAETDARPLLHRLIYAPESVTRIYLGPDYVVREVLFVPIPEAAAVLTYEVESANPMEVVVHFTPVLNLMWPGSIGGQATEWDKALGGYRLFESSGEVAAMVVSPETVAHDRTLNTTFSPGGEESFVIRPSRVGDGKGQPRATVYVALQPPKGAGLAETLRALRAGEDQLRSEAALHYSNLQRDLLRVRTPDAEVNAALAWAGVALDQAWVCNARLGCGLVAGYGPSRSARRPQYAWFFGGDGLVATNALIATTNYARAREELEFIQKYQDAGTGMVWHELSQSAGYIDWSKYPYMFVHVDITFDYLATVARYVKASGDLGFAREHWSSVAKAYQYCRSIVSAEDHLPHIPAGKEGGDEQNRPADDLGLSVSWVTAARGFSELAADTGHAQEAREASAASEAARASIGTRYWDGKADFWIDQHTAAGAPILTRRSGFGDAIRERVFSPAQSEHILDVIASADFQTDWGARGASAAMAGYAPWSYTTASTSAMQSARTAAMFWQSDRPEIAAAIWQSILPLNWLDAPGHLHEVLAGSVYAPQAESVPEQTWSSAELLDTTMAGLLGLEVDGLAGTLSFRPHLPALWDQVAIENVRMTRASASMVMRQTSGSVELLLHMQGGSVDVRFAPQIPLGAQITGAQCGGKEVAVKSVLSAEDEHAELRFMAPEAESRCEIRFHGGVAIMLPAPDPKEGEASNGLRLIKISLDGDRLVLDLDVAPEGPHSFKLRTPWKVTGGAGARMRSVAPELVEIEVGPAGVSERPGGYRLHHLEFSLAR